MGFVIAVPSYRRSRTLQTKTLAMLRSYGLQSITTVFCVPEELQEYQAICIDCTVVAGRSGLVAQRNYIQEHYPEGTQIVFIDDDVSEVETLGGKGLCRLPDLRYFIESAFALSAGRLWSVYPASNHYFMSETITEGLVYCIGALYGITNLGVLLETTDEKEDVVRSIQYGNNVRFNNVTIQTSFYAQGGIRANTTDRIADGKKAVERIAFLYPDIGRVCIRKSGIYEFRFHRRLSHKSPGIKIKI